MEHISSPAITFITWFSKYLKAQWVNNRSKDDLHMNDVCEWEWVTEEGCLSIDGAGRFAPLCPHSKDQVRFSDTKGQVKICSAWVPKTLIMVMLYGGFQWTYIKAPSCSRLQLDTVSLWFAVTCPEGFDLLITIPYFCNCTKCTTVSISVWNVCTKAVHNSLCIYPELIPLCKMHFICPWFPQNKLLLIQLCQHS